MKPTDLRSNRWLVDFHLAKGDKAKCVEILTQLITNLERDGDTYEQVHAYERLLSIDDRYEHRWGLAKAQEKLGRVAEARREIRCLANLALRRKEFDQASAALEEILKAAPLDIEARKLRCELQEARGETEQALKSCEEIALVEILCGNVQEAEQYCRHLPAERSSTPEIVRRIGGLCAFLGDAQKAVEQLLKAAKLHLDQRDFGLSAATLNELFKIQPSHAEALALLARLKEKESAPSAPPAVSAPAAFSPPPAAPAPAQAPAAPAQGAARASQEAPPKEESGQIFESSHPLKTTVMAITAKLKRLKSGAQDGGAAPAAEAPAASSAEGSSESPRAGLKQLPPSAALKSAASRLKALAGKKGMEAAAGIGKAQAPQTAEDQAAPAEAPAAEAPAPARDPASASEGTPPPAAGPEAGGAPAGPGPSAATPASEDAAPKSSLKAKISKSISKLAQLKKQAAKTT